MRRLAAWLALLLLPLATMPARAEVIAMSVALSAESEVPKVTSAGAGTAAVTFNTETRELSWDVQVRGLTGPVTAAHFHGPATAADNGPVLVPIAKAGDALPFKGSAILTPAQAADFLAGRWYVNVHTASFPAGELRGQVIKK